MKVKTTELIGAALNWVVASIEWPNDSGILNPELVDKESVNEEYPFDTDWEITGPIIKRERITVGPYSKIVDGFHAYTFTNGGATDHKTWCNGLTPQIAAMRCFIVSKLGDEIEVPDHLL